ncbi:GntR family transcriptional regulator [Streptomyces hygroscopicus subsp. sporocinereus]|uniref:GntR family transcriptional regulator n=1 Tax=Streptomyces hygroscopicus TaxID=1912 RepID=A0ABQ3UG43_STRHY|nr:MULTISPECIES: GntR family transcriptional regulator [Streptomyces]MDN3057007.1 GntR family transcriptional regulator [Streptomyces sp. SRF1]GHJ34191.1 GntR family transcriptional regulator [Streptomyces hygroscopicus]
MGSLGNSSASSQVSLGNVRQRTAHETVVEALRHAILSGELPGGTRLVQSELAGRLGLSITPVREAIRQLATEGLIQLDSYRGAVVLTPAEEEMREVYDLLLTLTPMAARRAAERITEVELEQARSLAREMARTEDVAGWVLLHRRFHLVLYGAARSPRLLSIVTSLSDAAAPQIALSLREDASSRPWIDAGHAHLVDSFASRDPQRAVEAMLDHLQYHRRSALGGSTEGC